MFSVPGYLFALCPAVLLEPILWSVWSLSSTHKNRLLEFLFTYQRALKSPFCLYFRVWKSNHTLPILTEFIIRQIITLEWWMDCIKEDDKQVHTSAVWDRQRWSILHDSSAPDYRIKERRWIIQSKPTYPEFYKVFFQNLHFTASTGVWYWH